MAEDLLGEMKREDEAPENGTSEKKAGKLSFLKKFAFFKGGAKKTGKKKKIIIALILLILILSGAGAWIFFLSPDSPEDDPQGASDLATEENIQAALDQSQEIVFEDIVVMEPFERIPLKGGSVMGLISMDLALELVDHRFRKQVYTVQDRLRRIVEVRVREATWLELRSPQGKLQLKYEMLKQMNSVFPKVVIRNIYFTNFIMQ